MFFNVLSHCNIKLFRIASLKRASSSGLGRKLAFVRQPHTQCHSLASLVTAGPAPGSGCNSSLPGHAPPAALLKTPASHRLICLTGNVFCRWRYASDWHHTLQNQNLSTSWQGFFRFPLGMGKCKKKAHECHQGLGANKE